MRQSSPDLDGIETVVEPRLQHLQGLTVAVNRNRPLLAEIVHPQVVNPVDVVGMGVGHQQSVNAGHFVPQRLFAKVRRAVYQKFSAGVLDIDTAPQPLIFGSGRTARGALAPDHGNADGSS